MLQTKKTIQRREIVIVSRRDDNLRTSRWRAVRVLIRINDVAEAERNCMCLDRASNVREILKMIRRSNGL